MNMNKHNINRDKFLLKQFGICWHEFDSNLKRSGFIWPCKHCGDEYTTPQKERANAGKSFSSWNNFGKLWEWANTQFILNVATGKNDFPLIQHIMRRNEFGHDLSLINPDKFADVIYEYLMDKK